MKIFMAEPVELIKELGERLSTMDSMLRNLVDKDFIAGQAGQCLEGKSAVLRCIIFFANQNIKLKPKAEDLSTWDCTALKTVFKKVSIDRRSEDSTFPLNLRYTKK